MPTDAQSEPAPRPMSKRRWLRFGTRAMLACVTLLAIGLGIVEWRVAPQKRAVAAIAKMGGYCAYDGRAEFRDEFPALSNASPGELRHRPWIRAPKWIRERVGPDYFEVVISVHLVGSEVTDGGLEELKGLPELEWLDLNSTRISNAGLAHLKGMVALERLDLGNTQVSDAGLEHLKSLAGLKFLYLSDTEIGDAGLVHLEGLTSLEIVNLQGTQASVAGMTKLKKALPHCSIYY